MEYLGEVLQGKDTSALFTFQNRGLRTLSVNGIQAKGLSVNNLYIEPAGWYNGSA